jgi:hypothetical protein
VAVVSAIACREIQLVKPIPEGRDPQRSVPFEQLLDDAVFEAS